MSEFKLSVRAIPSSHHVARRGVQPQLGAFVSIVATCCLFATAVVGETARAEDSVVGGAEGDNDVLKSLLLRGLHYSPEVGDKSASWLEVARQQLESIRNDLDRKSAVRNQLAERELARKERDLLAAQHTLKADSVAFGLKIKKINDQAEKHTIETDRRERTLSDARKQLAQAREAFQQGQKKAADDGIASAKAMSARENVLAALAKECNAGDLKRRLEALNDREKKLTVGIRALEVERNAFEARVATRGQIESDRVRALADKYAQLHRDKEAWKNTRN